MTRQWLAALGFMVLVALGGQIAKSDFILTLDDAATGGIEVIVADNVGAGVFLPGSGLTTTHPDPLGDLGVIVFEGPIGDFLANSVVGASKPLLGPPGQLSLTSFNVSDGPGVITVSLTDTDFSSPIPFGLHNEIGGTADGTVVSEWGVDLDNSHFSFASGFGSIGPVGPGAFDEESSTSDHRPYV